MKLSDLTEKKGPIIGAPKGSQKDARMGTDDPSKYMRGGEWEAYREPQGINSPAGKIASGRKKGTTKTKNKKMSEGNVLTPGGPGASGDLVPRDHHALTLSTVADTTKANRTSGAKMPGSEAPTKQVKKTVKKSHDNRPGNVSDINESIDSQVREIVSEAIPRVKPRDYTADYELMDDKNEDVIGVARIEHGVIEILSVRNDLAEDFEGHIMSRLLSTIVRDADLANANLAIAMEDPANLGQKRFLERFGFRDVGKGVLKRNAGSVTPPSVLTARL